jgi:hypothetical protein
MRWQYLKGEYTIYCLCFNNTNVLSINQWNYLCNKLILLFKILAGIEMKMSPFWIVFKFKTEIKCGLYSHLIPIIVLKQSRFWKLFLHSISSTLFLLNHPWYYNLLDTLSEQSLTNLLLVHFWFRKWIFLMVPCLNTN